jgi:uncharacterized membrane protein YgdD (TMEM256/DUF423 family)
MNITLFIGAILGLSSMIMAAYVDHALVAHLSSEGLNSVLTAVRYHQIYAIVICMIGFWMPLQSNPRIKLWLGRSSSIFIAGIILFCFSIYCSKILDIEIIIYLTPAGGIMLMMGWGCLIRTALFGR